LLWVSSMLQANCKSVSGAWNQITFGNLPTILQMKLCAAVRRKGSTDQCSSKALPGCTLCLSHIRRRNVVLWNVANTIHFHRVSKLQALVRGWLLRRRLALAGPGVLCRTGLANEEDLGTCDVASREYPLDYFAFEEAGKIWWFHFPTLWRWACRSTRPVNPYTKVPLSSDTTTRLRAMWRYKAVSSEPTDASLEERMRLRLNILSQLFHDNGFEDMSPTLFLKLSRSDWVALFRLIRDDLEISLPPHHRLNAQRYLNYIEEVGHPLPTLQYRNQASRILFMMLMQPKDPYILVYTTIAALRRL